MGGSEVYISCSWGVLGLLLLSAVAGTVQCRQCPPGTPPGLSEDFYAESCPQLFDIVKEGVKNASLTDIRIFASLLRVSFHDCWIGGCDASLLLDNDTSRGFVSEKFALPNANSIRGFPVLDAIKAKLEHCCPKTVSCADIVTVAGRDSVVLAGGKSWPVVLGRRDSLTSHFAQANGGGAGGLPSPFDTLQGTIANFANRSFTADEMVTLSGSHTFGRARCAVVAPVRFDNDTRGLNDTAVTDPALKAQLLNNCKNLTLQNVVLNNLDQSTPDAFDNKYYINLQNKRGILHTDQNLFSASGANTALVKTLGSQNDAFLAAFAQAMIKMQNLAPLTGTQGEIRLECGKVNPTDDVDSSSSWSRLEETLLAIE